MTEDDYKLSTWAGCHISHPIVLCESSLLTASDKNPNLPSRSEKLSDLQVSQPEQRGPIPNIKNTNFYQQSKLLLKASYPGSTLGLLSYAISLSHRCEQSAKWEASITCLPTPWGQLILELLGKWLTPSPTSAPTLADNLVPPQALAGPSHHPVTRVTSRPALTSDWTVPRCCPLLSILTNTPAYTLLIIGSEPQ